MPIARRPRSTHAAGRPPRVLLVESLDAAGGDRSDARERGAVLRAAGAVVRLVTLEPGGRMRADESVAPGAVPHWPVDPAGLSALRGLVREGEFDRVLVAAASPGGGPPARVMEPGVPAHWWPTGLAAASGWRHRFGLGREPGLPGLPAPGDVPEPSPAGIAWSSAGLLPAGRARLTLWDGDYLLAPMPLAGEAGSRALEAFAELSREWSGLDLVVLSEPQPAFEREARARGVGTRVHFVGRAAREAEWAWWAHAAAAILAGQGAISGGLPLRGLAAGCRLAVASTDGPGALVATWLAAHGCGAGSAARGGGGLAAALARVLAREPAQEEARARGRALAARHGGSRLVPRLAAVLSGRESRRARSEAAA